jgi:hypothetical protein
MTARIKPMEAPFDVSPLDLDGELAFVVTDAKGKSIHITAAHFAELTREVAHRGDVVARDYTDTLSSSLQAGRDLATKEMRFQ